MTNSVNFDGNGIIVMLVFGRDKLAVRPIRFVSKADAPPRSVTKTAKK
ncbi:hypothetical protein OAS89_03650 [Alphaproteobacteria bacterium]|nr:hypothetical protein [Alphaproteobacteria bacterium]